MNIISQIKSEFKRGASAANLQAKRIAELKKDKMMRKKEALLQERKRLAEKKEFMDLEDGVRAQRSELRKRQLSKFTQYLPKNKTKLKSKARANLSRNTKSEAWSIGRQNNNPWQTAPSSKKKKSPWDNPFK